MPIFHVHAAPIDPKTLCKNDLDVPGVYAVTLRDDATPLPWVDAALDGFHSHVPVSVLDDFEFTVHDAFGVLIDRGTESFDAYTLSDLTVSVEKIYGVGSPKKMPSFKEMLAVEPESRSTA